MASGLDGVRQAAKDYHVKINWWEEDEEMTEGDINTLGFVLVSRAAVALESQLTHGIERDIFAGFRQGSSKVSCTCISGAMS